MGLRHVVAVVVVAAGLGVAQQMADIAPAQAADAPTAISALLQQYGSSDLPFTKLTSVSEKRVQWKDLAPYLGAADQRSFPPGLRVHVVLQSGLANPTKGGRLRSYWRLIVVNLEKMKVVNPKAEHPLIFANFSVNPRTNSYVWGRAAAVPSYWYSLPGTDYVLDPVTGKISLEGNLPTPPRGSLL